MSRDKWRRPSRMLLGRFEVAVALHRRAHQEAVAFLDDAFGIVLARRGDDRRPRCASCRCRPRASSIPARPCARIGGIAEFLGQIAFADQDAADARHILEHVIEVLDAAGIFDLQDAEYFACGLSGQTSAFW